MSYIHLPLQVLVQQLATAFGREAGCVAAAPPLHGPAMAFDLDAGGNGALQDVLLDIDQMCEELGSRASP
jgi:hypothetical protein